MSDHDFTDDWHGWRVRGRYLVSPDGQRLTQERLAGLLFRDASQLRLAGFASRRNAEKNRCNRQRVKVVVIELATLRMHGAAAG